MKKNMKKKAEKIVLRNPIEINGRKFGEFEYHPELITGEQFSEIDNLIAMGRPANIVVMPEMDATRHRYIAMMAIIAGAPVIDMDDLKRIQGIHDLEQLRVDGRNFMLVSSEEDLPESSSEGQPATILELSAQTSGN